MEKEIPTWAGDKAEEIVNYFMQKCGATISKKDWINIAEILLKENNY
jgi:hypothetical protein